MSLRHARGAFSSSRDFICLYCHLSRIYPHGRQRLRSQHTETSHGTASSEELALQPAKPKARKARKATQSKPEEPTAQPKASDDGLAESQPVRSETAGHPVTLPPKPPSAEAARLQQVFQSEFAKRRRKSKSQTSPPKATTIESKDSNKNQGPISKADDGSGVKQQEIGLTPSRKRRRRSKNSSKSSASARNKPSHGDDHADTGKTAVSNTGAEKRASPRKLGTKTVKTRRCLSALKARRCLSKASPKLIRKYASTSPPAHHQSKGEGLKPPTRAAGQKSKGLGLKPPGRAGSTKNIVIEAVRAADLELQPVNLPQSAVPNLSYGLDRVLFNPGVYHIQDPRSRVYNFDPYLQKIMPVVEFDFDALKGYITSSRDETLDAIAREHGKRYIGSSSSMTGILAHFHYLLSQWRKIHTHMLSSEFPAKASANFTLLQCAPNAIFLRWKNGHYAIDADKEFSSANILMMLGKSMEKLLTLSKDDFEKYRKSNPDRVPPEERNAPESYHYSTMGDFLMRSQLDAHDPRLPGTGMFDLKTRAVVAVRMHTQQYEKGMDYEIKTRHGAWESYEREYFDMIRAAFLKYSLQVRMGRMDGIFVAFHNTQRIFGFQYISSAEMDAALHGQWDVALGDQEFKLSLDLLNKVLDRATKKYPEQSLRIHFETRESQTPFMYIFAEPMTEDQINELQSSSDAKVEEFERNVLGLCNDNDGAKESDSDDSKWADMQASVEKEMEKDAISVMASEAEEEGTNSEGFNEGSMATSSEDEDIQKVIENQDNLERDHDHEDQDAVSQQEQNATASDEMVFQGDGESSEAKQDQVSTEDFAEATTEEQSMSIQDSNEVETVAEDGDQPSNVDETTLTAATESPHYTIAEDNGFNKQADAPFMDTVAQEIAPPTEPKELLAMTLTVRNKVNGKFVLRPEKFTAQDRWTVEYALADVQSAGRAWTLYRASQARRRKQLEASDEDEGKTADWYIRNLRELSRKGKEWRAQQDEMDKGRPKVVLRA